MPLRVKLTFPHTELCPLRVESSRRAPAVDKELYNCLAGKLDHVASMSSRSPETQTALQKAATQLRAATNKAQALSAISQAQSVVASVIEQVRSAGQDNSGLVRVSAILANAAGLIQTKG